MRTAEELSDKLSDERIWRVKEITAISNLASRPNLPPVEAEFYCRAGSALFYAHWEGFVKRAATHYLKYVAFQRVKISEMADFVMCLFMQQNLGGAPSAAQLLKLSQRLQFQQELRPKLIWKNIIQTDSNLSSNVLRKIVAQLGLDYSLLATKSMKIDGLILYHRNAIAHGEKGEVDLDTLNEMRTEAISLITLFRDMIENAVVTKAHLRPRDAAPAR